MITFKKKILLASNSPRRKELLGSLGVPFEVRTTPVDETYEGISPEHVSGYLAEKKQELSKLRIIRLLYYAQIRLW